MYNVFAPAQTPRHFGDTADEGTNDRTLVRDRQPGFDQPLLEYWHSIVPPKRLALEKEHRYAEYIVGRRLLLRRRVGPRTLAAQVFAVLGVGKPKGREQRGNRFGIASNSRRKNNS